MLKRHISVILIVVLFLQTGVLNASADVLSVLTEVTGERVLNSTSSEYTGKKMSSRVLTGSVKGNTDDGWITFSSNNSFTVSVYHNADLNDNARWTAYLEYAQEDPENPGSWKVWDMSSTNAKKDDGRYYFYLRGKGNTSIGNQNSLDHFVFGGSNIFCDGNIMTLLDCDDPDHAVMGSYCFYNLFGKDSRNGCSGLISAPDLPEEHLSAHCYSRMFCGCTDMTVAPELKAEDLAPYCYESMFAGSGLTTPPALPADDLALHCYEKMFSGCTDLVSAPVLAATEMQESCYEAMFYGCSSITVPPALPAEELAVDCYYSMFYACDSLASAPVLPATELYLRCYGYMFSSCENLQNMPSLPAGNLAESCYEGMFRYCRSLKQASELSAVILAPGCYSNMFKECNSLQQAPDLPATVLAEECYAGMFSGCTMLKSAPAINAVTLASECCTSMFKGCSSLKNAPLLSAEALTVSCYKEMFSECTSLRTAPQLPAEVLAESCYDSMFSGCSALQTAPTLSAETLAESCYQSMFSGCISLKSVPELPADSLAKYCYRQMFEGCTMLTQLPELTAGDAKQNCYQEMFKGCTNIRVSAVSDGRMRKVWNAPSGNQCASMLAGTGGTFKGTPVSGTRYYQWDEKCIVIYDGNGSDSGTVPVDSNRYSAGALTETLGNTGVLGRSGYTFDGWNTAKDGSGISCDAGDTVVVRNDTTLYAVWKKNSVTYKITYVLNGGTNHSKNPVSYKNTSDTIRLYTPVRSGYTFEGWYSNSKFTGYRLTEIPSGSIGNCVLYAKWSANTYSVVFNGNGATSGTMKSLDPLSFGVSYALTSNSFKKTGYTFVKWNTKKDGSGTSYSNKAKITNLTVTDGGKVTLYAQWTLNTYTIAFNGNGASSGSMKSMTSRKYGTAYVLTANAFKRTGYTFKSWNTSKDGKGTSYSDKSSVRNLSSANGKTVTLFAQWEPITYQISFNGNGATSGKMNTSSSLKYGASYRLGANQFKKTGYVFTGWCTSKNGKGTIYKDKATIKNLSSVSGKTVVLYAIWKKK